MQRIILHNEKINLDTTELQQMSTKLIGDVDFMKRRSKKYLDLITKLDTKTMQETGGKEELMKAIQEEFGTAELLSLPLGIVSKCFLGHPYEVHTLDLSGSQIIKHYKINEAMDPDFEKARTLAKHNAYVLVEVYKDKILLIREDGTTTKL